MRYDAWCSAVEDIGAAASERRNVLGLEEGGGDAARSMSGRMAWIPGDGASIPLLFNGIYNYVRYHSL